MRLSGPVHDRYQVELYLRYSRYINIYRESSRHRTFPPNLSRGRKIEFIKLYLRFINMDAVDYNAEKGILVNISFHFIINSKKFNNY